jgi:hypothetical protein
MKLKSVSELGTEHKIVVNIHSNIQDINHELQGRQVNPMLHGHWTDGGVEQMIVDALTERGAVFPANVMNTEFANVAKSAAMFTQEIKDVIEAKFTAGTARYPLETVETYLSVFMPRKGKVGKIKLTGAEDKDRKCCKPRTKWFLIA